MQKLVTLTLIVMLIIISYAVIFCQTISDKYFIMVATGYCPCEICCAPFADGFTATGDKAGRGCIAIDPKAGILKMGQWVWVEGYGYGKCNDVGGSIKGWHIDLCFDTHQEALEWGRKLVKVYVLK